MIKLLLAFASLALMLFLPMWIESPTGQPYLIIQRGNFRHITTFTIPYDDMMVSVSAKTTPKEEKVNVFAWQDRQGNMHFSDQAQSFQKSQVYEVTDHFSGRFSFPDYWVWACMFAVWLLFYATTLLGLAGLTRGFHAIHHKDQAEDIFTEEDEAPTKEKKNRHINYEKVDSHLTTAYKTLGVGSNASSDEIKAAYRNKIKQYHPDKVANLGKELQDVARKKSTEINRAYRTLQPREMA